MASPQARKLESISRKLSYVLRHNPAAAGVALGEGGWADVAPLLTYLRLADVETLRLVVALNDKKRFELSDDGARIRAVQGHSVPVDLAYKPKEPPDVLYHGTTERAAARILGLREGLRAARRQHVHMTASRDAAWASASRWKGETPVLLSVFAESCALREGIAFYEASNHVWLAERIPVDYVARVEP